MIQRSGVHTIVLLTLAALVGGGCIGSIVQREELEATAKLAVVSVVMPRVGDNTREGNRAVLQEAVDHAAEQVRRGLAGVRGWKVMDPARSKEGKAALSAFGTATRADLAAVFPKPQEQDHAQDAVGAELRAVKEQFIGARGLLVVPREALLPDEEQEQKDETIRPLTRYLAGKLCKDLQVDAVAFVHVRYTVSHPRESAFIVTEDRTDGLLAASATLVVVDKTGKIIVDTGIRPANETSRNRDLLPLYRGAGRDAVTPANIDLADPKKKIIRALTALVDESVADLMDLLKEALKK